MMRIFPLENVNMRKSTLILSLALVTLFVISINIIQQIGQQNQIIKNELDEKRIKDALVAEITSFEDFIASINYSENIKDQNRSLPLFNWILDIQAMNKGSDVEIFSRSFLESSGIALDQTSFEIAFISILPLINASQNLPNRVFYGKSIDTNEQKQIFPFAVTKSSNLEQSKTYFGWADTSLFLTKIEKIADLNVDYELNVIANDELTSETRIIENKSPPINIVVSEYLTTQSPFSINFEFFKDTRTLMLLAINLLLWFALGLSLIEHLKRVKSEERLKEAIDLGQQHAKLATIGELASGIAHEINQPLATIETYAGLTKRALLKSSKNNDFKKEQEYVDEIRNQTDRCSRIIKSVLSLKVNDKIKLTWLNLEDLKENIGPIINLKAKKHSVKINWSLLNKKRAFSDKISLEQIILNICTNGIEAMQNTPLSSRILNIKAVDVQIENKNYIEVIVSDRGCGIPINIAKNLFNPFVTYKTNGTGLGLSLCKTLSEKCLIDISHNKNPHDGTDFRILIPAFEQTNIPESFYFNTNPVGNDSSVGILAK